ncbi:MAG TPA: ABC transporter permease [Rhodocyclaceae bacterium]|nr:ABC transporter permease [Rhodocyclaceae bacterium]HMV54568.1 ABC transporter permease [Rhodocyclaceae bacterium]HMZ83861.1 ABC transporter permease [Rhodocyclaceae bacterium]HNB78672.1 ABC transporter permease [Rhodocyclaceae bacterium]HNH14150.1 ABC transporter permease [Rhodocyclaceae bacterium]
MNAAPSRLRRIRVLVGKEAARLLRNPPALMAIGLMVLMALLVALSRDPPPPHTQAELARGCWLVYWEDDGFVPWLRRRGRGNATDALPPPRTEAGVDPATAAAPQPATDNGSLSRVPVRFVPADRLRGSDNRLRYPPGLGCAVEWRLADGAAGRGGRDVVFRPGSNEALLAPMARWLLAAAVEFYGERALRESMHPLPTPAAARRAGPFAGFDFSAARTQSLVGAMLLFSLQFFVCCALFVSFASHERERGILQALALTAASPADILAAKYVFHLALSLIAGATMVAILDAGALARPGLWLSLCFTAAGLLGIATLIVSFTRTQTAASLIGFCYLMGVGMVFALSKSFPAFGWMRLFMFENYSFLVSFFMLGGSPREAMAAIGWGMGRLALISLALLGFAAWVFNRRGWRSA